jgi:hypothetical protein
MSSCVFIIVIMTILAGCSGIIRQKTVLEREDGVRMEFVHVAKAAGRSIKYAIKGMGDESPIDTCHKHSVRVADVLARNSTAIAILREPVERTESAFIFVRSGGFGKNLAPNHALVSYNSTDSFITSLAQGTPRARQAVRCEAKMKYCAPNVDEKNGEKWDVMKHTSIEFRPQSWWLNPPLNHRERDVRIVCYPDLKTVFPNLSERLPRKASFKGHFYLDRYVTDASNVNAIKKDIYHEDEALYAKYCTEGSSR